MANKQIKEYNEQTTIDDSDKLLLQDASTDEYKYFLLSTLRAKILGPNGDGAWTTATPTFLFGAVTVGNGTQYFKYRQVGKTVEFEYKLKFGSTTTMGNSAQSTGTFPAIAPPVTANSRYLTAVDVTGIGVGHWYNGSTFKGGTTCLSNFGTGASISVIFNGSSPAGSVGTAFVTNDCISIKGSYEAA